MGNSITDKTVMPQAAKLAIVSAGIMPRLNKIVISDHNDAQSADLSSLSKRVWMMIEDLEQLMISGKLNDVDIQKLSTVLIKLRGALQGGNISRETLAAVLSEAAIAIGTADNASRSVILQQKIDRLWMRIGEYNKAIHDDFENMREAGIVFNEELWHKHERLWERLQEYPQDIAAQKELNAVDDQLLNQADPQLKKCPNAQPHFGNAKAKSKERHKDVLEMDALIAAAEQNIAGLTNNDFSQSQGANVTMDDVTTQFVAKQTPRQNSVIPPRG